MEYYTITLLFIIFTISIFGTKILSKSKLPPGPTPWPIIGNIFKLGDKPHRSVAELAKIYGPIMSLKLGSITTIVISSPEVAREMFLKHDLDFSGRANTDALRAANHDQLSMVFLPVGPKWRNLRKIATVQLFTGKRLDASQIIRQKKVDELIEYARHCSERGLPLNIGKAAFTTTLNLLSSTFFSMDLASHVSSDSQEFKDLVWQMMVEGARPNVSDFFPIVKEFDLQGVLRRATYCANKMLGIFEEIIEGRLRNPKDTKDDVLDTLLKLVEDKELSLDEVKHLLFDLFAAGTDTTASTLEWAMTELLRNPDKMAKAQNELDEVFGKGVIIQETNISKLTYIQAIVKETYRLHPAAPFLIPYKAEKNVELCDYFVPKNTQLWVNVWSIGRDPRVWPNPLMFSPERFIGRDTDVKGRDFELIPFGAGRRICPGIPLAYRMLHLMLATLLHSFNWKYHDGENSKDIDVEEKFGITLQKAQPLQAIPLARYRYNL
ncbi:cytochrome P450 76AD1 isoform X2 [Beta vulgaris subsp. vulgaris]|uniref:cytochrome P450 76AD1 isoform X2 n=1 Tax=Beta vulgaris subsp. vulgaris TaxID=3555 RepID=UPI0025482EAF|nr:cytochrome P450 76AD1 isoform X2 [Beta vulgaris subsp. vulgaris]